MVLQLLDDDLQKNGWLGTLSISILAVYDFGEGGFILVGQIILGRLGHCHAK